MTRVLHILGELKPSGAEVMYHAAAELWQKEGLECEILSIGEKPGVFAPILESDGYRIHHLFFSSRAGFLASAWHLLAVYRFLKKNRFDVIHINSEYANFWYALLAWMTSNARLFRTIHGTFQFRGLLGLERHVHRFMMRHFFHVKMIAVSRAVHDTELKFFGNTTMLIWNWFDCRRFRPPTSQEREKARYSLGIPSEATVITSVGNCDPVKNHAEIIHAIAKLPPEAGVVYCHAGLEDGGHCERGLAIDLGVANKVRFLGFMPDVVPLLHGTDIYVMPSFYEGLGVAALEGLAAGLPALLSRVNGLNDLAEVCQDIHWVDPIAESIRKGILHFINMPPEQRRCVGLRLSSQVHERFGLQNGAMAYARLYKGDMTPAGIVPA